MDDDDEQTSRQQHDEEFQVLQSIYPDYIVDYSAGSLTLHVPVELGTRRHVLLYAHTVANDETLEFGHAAMDLNYLPSILIEVTLPPSYPVTSAPVIRSIHATHSWLLATAELACLLLKSWSEGEGVLCDWVEAIRGGVILDRLQLVDGSGVIRLPCAAPQFLEPLLIDNDSVASAQQFSSTTYACSICLTSLKGSRCILLSCRHVFCRQCLQDFWGLHIAEGSIESIRCPDEACVKGGREVDEEELRRVVSDEEVKRCKWLRTKVAMEKDPTMVHCPVATCQAAVPKPVDANEGSGWDRFRCCPSCGFPFCAFCKRTWHGPIVACPKSISEGLVQQYLELPEGSQERYAFERKFGAGVIKKLCREYLEEKLNSELIDNSTTPCPGCNVRVEKSVGCNHMTCGKCKQHFCYLCGEKLNSANPYLHFNDYRSPCYQQLFDVIRETL